jgi:UDP-N-acetylglucosamine 4-epimerase
VFINGDGSTSRDFCYVDNAVQANILSATTEEGGAINQIYNIAVGDQTSLNELYSHLKKILEMHISQLSDAKPIYRDSRVGDIQHSLADIGKAKKLLGYQPAHKIVDGLLVTIRWYLDRLGLPH